jgi:hypothetical protein
MVKIARIVICASALACSIPAWPGRDVPPSAHISIDVSDGCAVASVASGAKPVELDWQGCHGWSVMSCHGSTVLLGKGVRVDQAHVLLVGGRLINVTQEIEHRLGESHEEALHLDFDPPECSSDLATLRFEGSRIGIGESGSAGELRGRIDIGRDRSQLTIR